MLAIFSNFNEYFSKTNFPGMGTHFSGSLKKTSSILPGKVSGL